MKAVKLGTFKSVAIAVVTLAVAWEAYSFALVPNLRRSAPEVVLSRDPYDAPALSKRVLERVKKSGQYIAAPEDRTAAVRSLVDTPLSRSSLRIIGFDYVRQQDKVQAAALMSLSNKVSRRDTWAQIWLLEEAARNEDFDSILSYYHAALSVKPELAPVLNPILVSVTRFLDVRVALGPYLRSNAPWTSGFLAQAANDARVSDVFDTVLPEAQHLSGDAYIPALSRITYRLALDDRWGDAMRLAETIWNDFDSEAFSSFSPEAVNSDPRMGTLAWTFSNEAGIFSELEGEGGVSVSFEPLSRGVALRRTIPVERGGRYAFVQRVQIADRSSAAQVRWQAECVSGSSEETRVIWRQTVPWSEGIETYRSTISVPDECSLLTLSLIGTGPDGQTGSTSIFSDLSLSLT